MEELVPFHLLISDVLLSLLSLVFFVGDVVLDAWAVVSLYQEEEYIFMGLLIFLLVGSSVLMQIFSWIWYQDSYGDLQTGIERFIQSHGLLPLVHVCQLGIFLRFGGVVEISIRRLKENDSFQKNLNHDLSMLRLFEAFSESAPQLTLMMIIILRTQELQLFTAVKLVGSLSALALTVLFYHRNMRSLVPEKFRMGFFSSFVYFLWNLLLIGSRVASVSLFASVLPSYVVAHVLSSWMLLVFWAWRQKTDFMNSKAGEWLYRGNVGLIWYFSWFNVASGGTKIKAMLYHVAMGVDIMVLLGLWWWRRSVESARLGLIPLNPYVLIGTIILTYVTGLVLKVIYYWKWHPNKTDMQSYEKLKLPERCTSLEEGGDANSDENLEGELRPLSTNSSSGEGIYKIITEHEAHYPEPPEGSHKGSSSDLAGMPEPNPEGSTKADPTDVGSSPPKPTTQVKWKSELGIKKRTARLGKFSGGRRALLQQDILLHTEFFSLVVAGERCMDVLHSEPGEGSKFTSWAMGEHEPSDYKFQMDLLSNLEKTSEQNTEGPTNADPTDVGSAMSPPKPRTRSLMSRVKPEPQGLQESLKIAQPQSIISRPTVQFRGTQEPKPEPVKELSGEFHITDKRRSRGSSQPQPATGIHKRMRKMAGNFYGLDSVDLRRNDVLRRTDV